MTRGRGSPPHPEAFLRRVVALKQRGLSCAEVAAATDVTKNAVVGILHRHGWRYGWERMTRREAAHLGSITATIQARVRRAIAERQSQ